MELKVIQIHELATIAPGHVACAVQFVDRGSVSNVAAVAAVHEQ